MDAMITKQYNMMFIQYAPRTLKRRWKRFWQKTTPGLYLCYHMARVRMDLKNEAPMIRRVMEQTTKENRLFDLVEIENINRCNGTCEDCSANALYRPQREPRMLMSVELFKKIIDELHDMEYCGCLRMHSNNEPLLDDRIYGWLKYAREQLPYANIYLYTNATMLTTERFEIMMKYLDDLWIDNYTDGDTEDWVLLPVVRNILDMYGGYPAYRNRVTVIVVPKDELRYNKANDAPNYTVNGVKRQKLVMDVGCTFPFRQLSIRPDGRVILCCNDVFSAQGSMGDANVQSLKEIWYGEQFRTVRERLLKGRQHNPRCNYCDFVM